MIRCKMTSNSIFRTFFNNFLIRFLNIDLNRFEFYLKSKKVSSYRLKKKFIREIYLAVKIQLIKLIFRRIDNNKLMINIGGGTFFRKHWRVLDYPFDRYAYPSYYIDYVFDLASNKPLPFEDNLVQFFYSSHTIEHIPQERCQHIFNEIYRCLKRNGAVRLTMPDFDKGYEAYANNDENFFKKLYNGDNIKERFLNFFATFLEKKISTKEFRQNFEEMKRDQFADYYTSKIPRDWQEGGGEHINWWNFQKAEKMLIKAGFETVYRSTAQKSRFAEMRGIGYKTGFDSTHPEISVFIEAIKR